MAKREIVLAAAALAVGMVSVPRAAYALGPLDLEVGAKVGAGTNPFASPNPNPLGLGIGGRAGVSFLGLYGGLNFMYYLGSSGDTPVGNVTEKAVQYGIEGGYGGSFSIVTLRGQIGVGNLQITSSGALNGNAGKLYVEPGVTLLVGLAGFFVGADANVLILPGVSDPISGTSSFQAAFTAHGQVGVKF